MPDELDRLSSTPRVSRRAFVGTALSAGALAATGLALPIAIAAEPNGLATLDPALPASPGTASLVTPSPGTPATLPPFALDEATIAGLQSMIASGQHTSRSLCEAYMARIAEIDKAGPALRAVLELNPDALTIADGLDAERRAGKSRGP